MEDRVKFVTSYQNLHGNMRYEASNFDPEYARPFTVATSGPYVHACDYFLLLRRYQDLLNHLPAGGAE